MSPTCVYASHTRNTSGRKSNAFKQLLFSHRVVMWIFDRVCPITSLPVNSLLVVTLPCDGLACTDIMYLLWAPQALLVWEFVVSPAENTHTKSDLHSHVHVQ